VLPPPAGGFRRRAGAPAASPPLTAPGEGTAPAQPPPAPAGGGATLKERLKEAERGILLERLERNRWQMARTARDLGIERSHLYRKLKALGIRPPD
jgi:DNA-binding NtrC family response regulator